MKIFLTVVAVLCLQTIVAQVKIYGTVKNYDDTVFYIKETGLNNFTGQLRDNQVKVRIENNGYFNTTIPEKAINTWYIKTKSGSHSATQNTYRECVSPVF